jgi:hypothetical protein
MKLMRRFLVCEVATTEKVACLHAERRRSASSCGSAVFGLATGAIAGGRAMLLDRVVLDGAVVTRQHDLIEGLAPLPRQSARSSIV